MTRKPKPAPSLRDQEIGLLVRKARTERGMSQEELAKACNISFQQIQKYERGTNRISVARLEQISHALNVSISALFGLEPLRRSTIAPLLDAVDAEVSKAMENWPPFNSAHEGYGVLLEEVDELWEHIKTNQKRRDLTAMKQEAIQVAAMAVRFAFEVCNEERGRK